MRALASAVTGGWLRRPLAGRSVSRRFLPGRRARPRTVAAVIAGMIVLGAVWLWVRDSALVSVNRVTVTGVSGSDAAAIRSALTTAARGMTTLDVNQAQLRAALVPYPEVKSLQISTQVPHGLRIRVIEQLAVAQVVFGGRSEAVTADGILLGSQRTAGLPQVALPVPPGGARVTDPAARAVLRVLGAAPYQLLSKISHIKNEPAHGIVALLRGGPAIYLGDGQHLHAKWLAAAAVLADPGSAGAVLHRRDRSGASRGGRGGLDEPGKDDGNHRHGDGDRGYGDRDHGRSLVGWPRSGRDAGLDHSGLHVGRLIRGKREAQARRRQRSGGKRSTGSAHAAIPREAGGTGRRGRWLNLRSRVIRTRAQPSHDF